MSITIKGDFLRGLRSSVPEKVKSVIKPPKGSMGAPQMFTNDIPPINTDITFSGVIPDFKLSEAPGLSAMPTDILPEQFDWGHSQQSDTDEIKRKKNLITPPGNQRVCGSCWASKMAL
jgi:hypothetical protein